MIQFKRGTTKSWRSTNTKLAAGQPGYDKDKHKIKVGDGDKTWSELPYATGLFAEEILNSEEAAKSIKSRDPENLTLITYGVEVPNENTVGQIYLQQHDTEPEVDYVIESGINGIWTYQKWKSGIAKCWGTYSLTTSIQSAFESELEIETEAEIEIKAKVATLFYGSSTGSISYPFTFERTPTETAVVQGGRMTWLANTGANTKKASGSYTIISPNKQLTSASYGISIQVEGFWR